ncbi:MAG: hypothetical protein ACRD2N_12200 [Vicinamibacterales bacterium]
MTSLLPAFLAATLAIGQASSVPLKPDFTGTWALDRGRSASTNPGERLDIKQTDNEIVVEMTRDGKPSTRTYPIDPSARPSTGVSADGSSRAYWVGAKLVTEGLGTVQGQTVSTRETLALNPAGTEMTVERLVVVQHGYSFRGARNYGTAKDVYTRSR